MHKKGVELSTNTIIILILIIIVLVVIILIFTGAMKDITSTIWVNIKNALGFWDAASIKP